MRVAKRNGPVHTLFFSIPENEPFDLKKAWLKNCCIKALNVVVRCWEPKNVFPFGTSKRDHCYGYGRERIGTIIIRPAVIYDAGLPPSYEVMIDLESGVNYCDVFECNIKDLIARIKEDLLDRPTLLYQSEVLEAMELITTLDLTGQETCPNAFRPIELQYAGVKIGTFRIRKVT
jgi:hypothetical protein